MSNIDAILSKGDVANGERSRERAHKLLNDFKKQLGIPSTSNIHIDHALENFLIEAVLGAAWYQARSKRALRGLWIYIAVNAALVICLPLGLIGLANLTTGTAAIPAQITGILTGILALQKTLSQWYASQQRYVAWYKARSDLKTVYYGLIQQWSGRIDAVDRFLVALNTATDQSRKIIDDEQIDYFQRLALPSFDVLDMLTSTRAGVSSFVTSLLPGSASTVVTAIGRTSFTGGTPVSGVPGETASDPTSSEMAPAVPGPLFRHSLHSPITTDPEQVATLNSAFSRALGIRSIALAAPSIASGFRPAVPVVPPVVPPSVEVAMLTATAASYFDSYLFVRFKGGQLVQLLADSGNTCLIMPCLDDLQSLPNFGVDYEVLASSDGGNPLTEPWGQAAVLVKGPIEIDTGKGNGSVVTIPDCVFYACKSSRDKGTANFGLGIIATWQQVAGHEVRSPLTYNTGYNFVEIDLADAPTGVGGGTSVTEDSRMRLYKAKPSGYTMMKILSNNEKYKSNNLPWMALKPLSLSIGGKASGWPSGLDMPIAMIDTGGTQPYLSDPSGKTTAAMSGSTGGTLPDWVSDPGTSSTMCSATNSVIGVELGDDVTSYAYAIDLTTLPATDRATSLVVCTECGFMRGQPGMNIGGLSMLFNSILMDISNKTVGFMKKSPA